MPDYIEVSISVKTPRFNLELTESDPATATAEDQDVQGALLLGKLADAVLRYFGHTDAFAQYVAITQLLAGEDPEGAGTQGVHARRVRELLADNAALRKVSKQTHAALLHAADPANWLVDLVHDPVGAVNRVDSGAAPRSDTYRNVTSSHDGATALPAEVLAHVSERLTGRIDDIIAAARQADAMDQVMDVRKIILETLSDETRQAAYRTRVRPRLEQSAEPDPAAL